MKPKYLLSMIAISVCCHSDYQGELDNHEALESLATHCDTEQIDLNRVNTPEDIQPTAKLLDMQKIKLTNSITRISQNAEEDEPYYTEVLGHTYRAMPDVFSPKYFRSTGVLTKALPLIENERFLEIGTGIGVTAITAARDYLNSVVAVDLNPSAVKVTRENAAMHGVTVDVRESDVFSAMTDERFDTIYWDLPYVYAEGDECSKVLFRAVCDPEYRSINVFLKEVRNHLSDNGRIFIGFGTNGDEGRFDQLLEKYSFKKTLIHQEHFDIRGGMDYYLYQLVDNH